VKHITIRNIRSGASLSFLLLLSFLLSFASAEEKEIRILYLNDFHGFAESYKPLGSREMLGGIPYLAAKVNALRREKPSLLLSAGDMIQGNAWANLSQGESVIEMMNAMHFDAMVVGNHEFDFGQDVLKKRISEAAFPVLGANVEGMGPLKPYVIKELNGIKIALVGITTEDTPLSTHPRNVSGLNFHPPADRVISYLNELKDRADIILVLSHIGYKADRDLAGRVEGIDVIVGGHSHTRVEKPSVVGKTIIVQAWEHGKVLGVLDLTFGNGKITKAQGHLEEIKPETGKEDRDVLAIVQKYRQKVDAALSGRVGETEVDLDGENVRKAETNLGDLVTDIIRQVSGAEVAIVNGGGIRTSIKKGEIRVRDVYSVLPFDNYIVAITLTGREIREALEHGVSAIEKDEGRFPQVSGLTFTYSPSAPVGSRVKEVIISGKPLEPDREYSVATNDFLAAGGDGYRAFGDAIRASKDFEVVGGMMKGEKLVYSDSGRWLKDVVIQYLREKKTISPKTGGRIKEVP
jgi:2',3'-cyclic-nucleotide 2'-phosphodiesterase (5'-nucleotidase family)